MNSLTTFYLSGIIGKEAFGADGDVIGTIRDLLINAVPSGQSDPNQQIVTGVKLKIRKRTGYYSFKPFRVSKAREAINITCTQLIGLSKEEVDNGLLLDENILDKQIVDLNGRKLVRVNDVKLATLPSGTFAIAVDIVLTPVVRAICYSPATCIIICLTNSKFTHFLIS